MTEFQFLEAPLVRQADGELKNSRHKLINLVHFYSGQRLHEIIFG